MKDTKILYQLKHLEKDILRGLRGTIDDENMSMPTPTQIGIIHYIVKNSPNPVYQKDLEEALNLRRATISGVLKTMEKNGLIKRKTSKLDARVKEIVVANKTLEIYNSKQQFFNDVEEIIKKGIDSEKLEIFSSVINQMIVNLESNLLNIKGERNND